MHWAAHLDGNRQQSDDKQVLMETDGAVVVNVKVLHEEVGLHSPLTTQFRHNDKAALIRWEYQPIANAGWPQLVNSVGLAKDLQV